MSAAPSVHCSFLRPKVALTSLLLLVDLVSMDELSPKDMAYRKM
jgi:hypothetical protein